MQAKAKVIKSKVEGDPNDPVVLSSEEVDRGDWVDMRDVLFYETKSFKKAGYTAIEQTDKVIFVDSSDHARWMIDILPV